MVVFKPSYSYTQLPSNACRISAASVDPDLIAIDIDVKFEGVSFWRDYSRGRHNCAGLLRLSAVHQLRQRDGSATAGDVLGSPKSMSRFPWTHIHEACTRSFKVVVRSLSFSEWSLF